MKAAEILPNIVDSSFHSTCAIRTNINGNAVVHAHDFSTNNGLSF